MQASETPLDEYKAARDRRQALAQRLCEAMGWEFKTGNIYIGIRKVALAEAVPVGLDKLEAVVNRLEVLRARDEAFDIWASSPDGQSLLALAETRCGPTVLREIAKSIFVAGQSSITTAADPGSEVRADGC